MVYRFDFRRPVSAAILLCWSVLAAPSAFASGFDEGSDGLQSQAAVGTLKIVRQVMVTKGSVAVDRSYVDAKQGQSVINNQGLRTLRRSNAEINFKDGSILRVDERTDLVVQDAERLRTIELSKGSVWVKVAKGTATSVRTPTANAVARGTEFTVSADGTVNVYEGTVDVRVGGKTVSVTAGHRVKVLADGTLGETEEIPANEMPPDRGGVSQQWWNRIEGDFGMVVYPGSNDFRIEENSSLDQAMKGLSSGKKSGQIKVDISRPEPGPLKPASWNDLVFHRTETSYSMFGAGVLLSSILDRGKLNLVLGKPRASLYRMNAEQSYTGARGELAARLGNGFLNLQGNVLQLDGNPLPDTNAVADSELGITRSLCPKLSAFSGRMSYFEGPLFVGSLGTQLLADRYSVAGVRIQQGTLMAQGAYVYDADPNRRGAQAGWLGSARIGVLGGVVGVQALQSQSGPTLNGLTGMFSLPIFRNVLEGYGEFGKALDGTKTQSYGIYFPGIFQATGSDLFVEYAKRDGLGERTVVGVYRQISGSLHAKLYGTFVGQAVRMGFGFVLKG